MNPIYKTPWNKTINLDELLEIQSTIALDSENGPGLCIYLWYKGQATPIRCHRPMVLGLEYGESEQAHNWQVFYNTGDPTEKYKYFNSIKDNAKGSLAYQNFEKEIEQLRLAWARWKEYTTKPWRGLGPPQSPFAPDFNIPVGHNPFEIPRLPINNFWPRVLHLSIKSLTNADLKEINIFELSNKIQVKSSGVFIEQLLMKLEDSNFEIQSCSVCFTQLFAQKSPIQFYVDKQHFINRQPAYRFVPSEELAPFHNAKAFPGYPIDYYFDIPFILTKDSVIAMDIPSGDTIDLKLTCNNKIPVFKKSN